MLPLVLSSDFHVFEPPDLWQTRIDRAFRDRAPRGVRPRATPRGHGARLTRRVLPHGSRPIEGHRDDRLDNVEDGIKELERGARLGLSGAMITEYPAEDRRYDHPEYEPFWATAALDLPLSLHTATRQQGKIRGTRPGRCATGKPLGQFLRPANSVIPIRGSDPRRNNLAPERAHPSRLLRRAMRFSQSEAAVMSRVSKLS